MKDNAQNKVPQTVAQPASAGVRGGMGGGRGPMGGPMGGGRPGMGGGKPKNFKKAFGMLLKLLGKYKAAVIISLVLAVASVVLQLIGPLFTRDLTNEIAAWMPDTDTLTQGSINIDKVYRLGILIGSMYFGGAILSYIQSLIMGKVTQLVVKRMRTQITQKINKMPLKYFDTTSYGDILSRLTNDVDTIGQSLSMSVVSFISALLLLSGVLIMMFTVNWAMALTAIAATLIGFVIMFLMVSRSQKYFILQQKYLGELNGKIEETYSGHNVVKAYNAGPAAVASFSETNAGLNKAVRSANFFSISMHPLMNFIGNFGYVAICVVGALLMVNNHMFGTDWGTIAAFFLYVRLFSQPLGQIAQASQSLQSVAAASERVFEFLSEPELSDESEKTVKLEKVTGAVEFNNVKFGYVEGKTIIKDFSAKIEPGWKVAIVGPTGAGKTTIVNLLMRFYEIDAGAILVDGIDIRLLKRENVHDIFGMVLQDTWMFEGTIKENIVYNKTDISDKAVVKACKAANLDHFIRTLPKGYNTVMDDKANLSAGQKQLVTIARAMVENAPMLILDEATSSVDTRTEILIQQAMDRLMKGRTTFVIAHRLSTIKNADLILVLKEGDIIESGNHEELLEKKGFYAELYNAQFSEDDGKNDD